MDEVYVRRQWNDYRAGKVPLDRMDNIRWDQISGGVRTLAPQPFIHANVLCTDVEGDIAHSCLHGEGPHSIKVCITKNDNSKKVYERLLEVAGPKPKIPKPRAPE
jgi:hypothetical protein